MPSPFNISIAISDKGLENIYGAGQRVTLVKSVQSFVDLAAEPGLTPQFPVIVAWQAFQPYEQNSVNWTDSYFLCTTTTPLEKNAVIVIGSETGEPAVPGWTYAFAQGQLKGSPGIGSDFIVSNQTQEGSFSFCQGQSATVNDTVSALAPLNAVPVLYNEQAFFTPEETVAIFLSSCRDNGTVIPQTPSNALVIALSNASPAADVGFDDLNNTFYRISRAAVPPRNSQTSNGDIIRG
jgi:hypothetical protein